MIDVPLYAAAAAGTDWGILLATVVLSGAGLAYTIIRGRTSTMSEIEEAMSKRIDDLVRQVTELKTDNVECARRCTALERENRKLMREILKLENGD